MGSGKLDMVVFLMVVGVAALQLQTSTAQTTYVVLDSLGWTVPQSGAAAYTTWASNKNFSVGDTLVFNFATNAHTVAEVKKAAFDVCNTTGTPTPWSTPPVRVTLNSSGDHYYICTIPGHCSAGQKLAISVAAAATTPTPSPAATPPPSPTPSPAATPPPAPSPSPTPTTPPSPSPSPTPTPSPSPSGPSPSPSPSGPSPSPSPSGPSPSPSPSGPSPSPSPNPPAPSSNPSPPAPSSESTPPPAGTTAPPPPNTAASFAAAALPVTFLSVVIALFY